MAWCALCCEHLNGLAASLVDEDDRDENGKTLLSEARDVADEETQIERHDDK